MNKSTISTAEINPQLNLINGRITTTSKQVAEHFGKRHDDVLRAIRNRRDESGEWGVRNFTDTPYIDPQNGQEYSMFILTKDGFMFVIQKFTGAKAVQIQIAYINAFNAMEEALHTTHNTLPSLITSTQAGELATLISERFPDGRSRPYAWSRFNNHFRLSSYKTLPTSKFDEACNYIRTMPDKEKSLDLSSAFLPADGKYLVNIENGRAAYSKRVPDDACVMSMEQMLKAINDPNGLYVSTEKLAEFAVATTKRLANRCAYYEAKNKQASPSKAISH